MMKKRIQLKIFPLRLLGRGEIHLEQEEIGSYITNRTIAVTGAGGSIGSELCRRS